MRCRTANSGCACAGIMQNIFDGIQRPLKTIAQESGDCFIPRGVNVPALDVVKTWEFSPTDYKVPPHSPIASCILAAPRPRPE